LPKAEGLIDIAAALSGLTTETGKAVLGAIGEAIWACTEEGP
jgi:hypothetical protein